MIGYIKGKITHKTPTYIYVEAQGVGYHINISLNTYSVIESKQEAQVYTHMIVKEDDMSLYGFADMAERSVFVHLLSVSGVGANTARVILSYMTRDEVVRAIANEDVVSLNKVKGIGPKTAKRIILDLREKMVKESGIDTNATQAVASDNNVKSDALSALISLGFPKPAIEKHIKAILAQDPSIDQVEDLIKRVLKKMN